MDPSNRPSGRVPPAHDPSPEGQLSPVGESGIAGNGAARTETETGVVEYHFPVMIEVRSSETPDVDGIVEQALNRLIQGLENS